MALPMLVGGGAECGPSNALQGLSKRFDVDRGIQQDHFGAARAGSSREAFRSQQNSASPHGQDAARFFSASASVTPSFSPDAAYDLSVMHATLPVNQLPQMHHQHLVQSTNPLASWATDFIQQPMHATPTLHSSSLSTHNSQQEAIPQHAKPQMPMQWTPAPMVTAFRNNSMPNYMPQTSMHQPLVPVMSKRISWDKEFSAQELRFTSSSAPLLQDDQQVSEVRQQPKHDGDELARTAGLLLDNIKHETNPKFQKSQFMGLMKQLRDGEIIVEGNKMVEREGRTSAHVSTSNLKGKGREVDVGATPFFNGQLRSAHLQNAHSEKDEQQTPENPIDAYLRQENAEYITYWNDTSMREQPSITQELQSWEKLQADWDNFEATSTGIRPITHYRFQPNNPYMFGESTRTHHHLRHNHDRHSALESVLGLEAAVQLDPSNASAWYELGVKQQENEREHKALQALERAVELDPTHLPAWLALAVSLTNDNNRQGAFDSIFEWVNRNAKYQGAVQRFLATSKIQDSHLTLVEKYSELIQCLIVMARSDATGDVDADIQIALAVLLNTSEEYEKAQDCFKTALAVRPDDWLLYNRVGATMANSGRPEEALDYYYRALELNPGYIRARFNLGISCINLRRYEEAAHHILDALVLQESDGVRDQNDSTEQRGAAPVALWDSLKTTSLHMQRMDLAAFCDARDLEGFRNSFQ